MTIVADEDLPYPYRLLESKSPLSLTMERLLPPQHDTPSSSKKTGLLHSVKLPKKPSIHSLFPSFPQPTDSTTQSRDSPLRARSFSLVNLQQSLDVLSEPPLLALPAPSLLDDDPFANLTPRAIPHSSDTLLSHAPWSSTLEGHTPRARVTRPRSSGHGQARPAHTKPAFGSRPSLPSLHTLAQMNVSVPGRRVRKGTPGAHLPHEPWNMDLNVEFNFLARNAPGSAEPSQTPETQVSSAQLPQQETMVQTEPISPEKLGDSGTFIGSVSREIAAGSASFPDGTFSSRSLSGDDADMDSLPSLSCTTSEPSSSAVSRSSSVSSAWPKDTMDVKNADEGPITLHIDEDVPEEDDPLSYHSDFDYYTQSLSDLSDSEPDVDLAIEGQARHHSPYLGVTPHRSTPIDFEPGSSADTMRRDSMLRGRTQIDAHVISSPNLDSPQDGGDWRAQRSQFQRQSGREERGRGRETSNHNGGYMRGQSSGAYRGGTGGDDDDGDKERRGKPHLSVSSPDYTSESSDDDTDGITVYYSLDGASNGAPSRPHSRTRSRHSRAAGGSDDDVPLAQRVPTALSAQRSIRKQLRDERQQRKLERAKSSRANAKQLPPTCPIESLPARAVPTSSRKRSMSAAPASASNSQTAPTGALAVEDLTRKLMSLQSPSRTPPPTATLTYGSSIPTTSPPRAPGYSAAVSRSSSRVRHPDQTTYLPQKSPRIPDASSQDKPLRSMRSFHRPGGRHPEISNEQVSAPRLGHSTTAATSSRVVRNGRDVSAGYDQHVNSRRVSEDGRKVSAGIPRSSMDREGDVALRTVQRPPVPPVPVSDSTPPHISRGPVVQQRIFIGDMQRFNMVEITPATNAGDVIEAVANQGLLDRSGSWMVFEMAQDYGMERPIRDYELLLDVSASWNKDKLLNAFVIKQTPLARVLSRSALPTSAPMHRGWVEWESKRGKWSKRWMELREHGLWLSKRDTGKDETFLCSLSNFDAYSVTRRHKSPKPYVFAVKSTDHLSLFENAADYLHVFSCNLQDGEKWMQAILVARSYVLYQERHVLFAKTGESLSQAKPLARSRTRKQSVSGRPAQPLVNVPPPFSQAPSANVAFEPGSLLAKRKGDT
ncbi:hypothetical protein JVU11DRAFT_3388 [Chiua virens]|nr:hypothetical protein JVU11DRAFT_3388 [Chiua virens]